MTRMSGPASAAVPCSSSTPSSATPPMRWARRCGRGPVRPPGRVSGLRVEQRDALRVDDRPADGHTTGHDHRRCGPGPVFDALGPRDGGGLRRRRPRSRREDVPPGRLSAAASKAQRRRVVPGGVGWQCGAGVASFEARRRSGCLIQRLVQGQQRRSRRSTAPTTSVKTGRTYRTVHDSTTALRLERGT